MEDATPTKETAPGKVTSMSDLSSFLGTEATEATDQTKASATPTPARQGTLGFKVRTPLNIGNGRL